MIDIRHTDSGDIDLTQGDLTLVDSTEQHKADILLCSPGDYAETPTTGVGTISYLRDERPGLFLRSVSRQMMADGMRVKETRFSSDGTLIIDARYENH